MTTILDLLDADGIEYKKVSTTKGGEYALPCPDCGGHDRFRVWPEEAEGRGTFWCRGCGVHGSTIRYLMIFHEIPFPLACSILGIDPLAKTSHGESTPRPWRPREREIPGPFWRCSASKVVDVAQKILWSDKGEWVREWLQKERFLTLETIKAMNLGWMPKNIKFARTRFGLAEEVERPYVHIPRALTIPCLADDHKGYKDIISVKELVRVRLRRFDEDRAPWQPGQEELPRYTMLAGSSSAPMVLGYMGYRGNCIVVESELDAILIKQMTATTAIAMGSAQAKPDASLFKALQQAGLILVALDDDEAGRKASRWWLETFSTARPCPPLRGKDPTDSMKAGVDLREWVKAGEKIARGN
jgi:hypothetical protein